MGSAALQVRQLCERLEHPNWMPNPGSWTWARPDGARQGFGLIWRDEPGLANLLWLSMDMGRPPATYDSARNTLYGLVLTQMTVAELDGELLTDWAGVLPLSEFHAKLGKAPVSKRNVLENAYPLLYLLAGRRLECSL